VLTGNASFKDVAMMLAFISMFAGYAAFGHRRRQSARGQTGTPGSPRDQRVTNPLPRTEYASPSSSGSVA
jgi:hypothetical protein